MLGETEEESHCCCWRSLPQAWSQPQFLGLASPQCF